MASEREDESARTVHDGASQDTRSGRARVGGRDVHLKSGRGVGDSDDPERADAQQRIRASKLCMTSMYTSVVGGTVGFFVGGCFLGTWGSFLAVLGCGVVAFVLGVIGLTRLRRIGPASPAAADGPGIIRASERLAAKAPEKAYVGIVLGGLMALGAGGVIALTLLGLLV